MAPEPLRQSNISAAELMQAAESVARNGRRRTVRLHGETLAIIPQKSGNRPRTRKRRENGFLAAYGSVPPLARSLTDSEMTEIAAEEAAQEAARGGLVPYAEH
jgi:hypothetical protein